MERRVPRVLLTREEYLAWQEWSAPEWQPFKRSWLARGFRRPPSPSQRELLWEIADARPNDLARWVAASRATRAEDVFGDVLHRWRAFRGEALDAPDPRPRRDLGAAAALGSILRQLQETDQPAA